MTEPADDTNRAERSSPWVALRSAAYQTFLYQKMVGRASPDARPGDCVAVYDRRGSLFGHGLYNPRSAIAVRMLRFGEGVLDEAFWQDAIGRAAALRRGRLGLDAVTNAYRLVHAEGDDLSGLVADRYGDVLSVEVFSLGMWRMLDRLLPLLHEAGGTRHHRVHVDERVQRQEAFTADSVVSARCPESVNITEYGVRFRVQFEAGHKTGFFCDQRENRRRLAELTGGGRVLDMCCYSGGFGIYAKVLGGAAEVTCVDLDEAAVAMARTNANLNQVRLDTVQADAFAYMRQMQVNRRQYDVLALDPPKLIFGRNDTQEGRRKYADLNRLAAGLVAPGGLLLTCSCSGALGRDEFVSLVTASVRQAGRSAQILSVSGAGMDHPVSPRCAESSYLKAVWLCVR